MSGLAVVVGVGVGVVVLGAIEVILDGTGTMEAGDESFEANVNELTVTPLDEGDS